MVGPLISGYQLVTSEDMVNNRVGDTRLQDFGTISIDNGR